MPKIYSRYPLDNPHSRHKSLEESEYDQHRSTHPSTSSSLGGPDLSQFVCKECGRVRLSSAGLTSHRRSHDERPLANYEAFLGINQSACEECGKVCKSRSALARHLKIHQAPGSGEHKGKAQPKDFVCCVCGRVCKSLAGFKSHCRSHDRR